MGRRFEKNVNNTITRYIYDGINIIAETDANNVITTTYTYSDNIDEPLSMTRNSQTYFYHSDSLGSITKITDQAGNIVQEYKYDSFGNIVYMKDSTFVQPFTFTGREYDPETGLLYLKERTLDTKTGTFISKDPIGFKGGINLYAYVSNNPINFVDPFGLHEVHFLPLYKTLKPTYDRMVATYDDNGIPANISSGSINPDPKQDNCKQSCPTADSGTYDFEQGNFPNTLKKKGQNRYSALFIGKVPTTAPNPNNNNAYSAKGIWIHKGCQTDRKSTV